MMVPYVLELSTHLQANTKLRLEVGQAQLLARFARVTSTLAAPPVGQPVRVITCSFS